MDVNALCELICAFFAGICIEANLNPDRKRARRKIREFMQLVRAAAALQWAKLPAALMLGPLAASVLMQTAGGA
jgi:hypothetical protein